MLRRRRFFHARGLSIIEVVIVLMLIGILVVIGERGTASMDHAGRFQDTLTAMEEMREKLIGNASTLQSGRRADFGFWGYYGTFPGEPDFLADLQNGYLWISPYPAKATTDGWGNSYRYDGPDGGVDGILDIESRGADNENGGSGFDADLEMAIPVNDFDANTVYIYCSDQKGTLLLGAPGGATFHVSQVSLVSFGTTTNLTYNAAGYWSATDVLAGPCILRAYPNDASGSGGINWVTVLGGADAPAYLETRAVVYPKGGFSQNNVNLFEIKFPGFVQDSL